MKRLLNKTFAVEKQNVSVNEILRAFIQNLFYGFVAGLVPTAVVSGNDKGVIVAVLLYYSFLSMILNRPPYVTKLGKFVIFPLSCTVGFYLAYLLVNNII